MELFKTGINDVYKVSYDEKQRYAASCQIYAHDLTEEEIKDYLTKRRVMHVGKEHFLQKNVCPVRFSKES